MESALVVGGAGFIGSHVVRELLRRHLPRVVVYDNLSSGRRDYLEDVLEDVRLELVVADIQDPEAITSAMLGVDHVFHFAANPDIARAMTDPSIDFWQGTLLTHNVIEAMRLNNVRRITYASGSGVYGDRGYDVVDERSGPMLPISTYGASKLACEAMIAAYVHMFDFVATVFRFANVVGDRQTHGVTFDFVRRLLNDPTRLRIMGDGTQSKSYIHVDDVVAAMLFFADHAEPGFEAFNVGTDDYVTVTEIADLVVERLGLRDVAYEYTGGSRGWKGDVPIVRFSSEKLRSHGWRPSRTSREALLASIDANRIEAAGAGGNGAQPRAR